MPGLQQRLDDDSSSDNDSLSYQQEFAADTINDSGATATVIINKVEHADKNNADLPDEITVGQSTQDINNATNGITKKEEVANMDDDVFAEFSGNKITMMKEDIAIMDDKVFAEYQRKRNDILDPNHGKVLLDESRKLANNGICCPNIEIKYKDTKASIAYHVFYGMKTTNIQVYGHRPGGDGFFNCYRDFCRDHGVPSVLRRDNAQELKSNKVLDFNRAFR
jgi:hypothetical protein